MIDFIIIVVLALIVGAAARYVIKAKKRGAKCIGCSVGDGSCCANKKNEASPCCCEQESSQPCCCCHSSAK